MLSDAYGPQGSHLKALPAIQLWPDVEIKARLAIIRRVAASVKVNQVLYLGATPVHNPVMPVKWCLISEEGVHTSLGRKARAIPGKGMKPRRCTTAFS